jgi:hypothetical protein
MKTPVLFLSLMIVSASAFASDSFSLQAIPRAKVTKVTCHEQQHAGHDWSTMAEVELSVRYEEEQTTKTIPAAIVVSRFGDFDLLTREGNALCKQLKALQKSGREADILVRDEAEMKAIKGVTQLLTFDNPMDNG